MEFDNFAPLSRSLVLVTTSGLTPPSTHFWAFRRLPHRLVWGRRMWVAQCLHFFDADANCKVWSWVGIIEPTRGNSLCQIASMSLGQQKSPKRKPFRAILSALALSGGSAQSRIWEGSMDANLCLFLRNTEHCQGNPFANKGRNNFWHFQTFCEKFAQNLFYLCKFLYICGVKAEG